MLPQKEMIRNGIRRIALLLSSLLLYWGCLPKPPEYPYQNAKQLEKEAQKISDQLESYIYRWLKGEAPATIPLELIPKGYDPSRFKDFRLVRYEDITPQMQWIARKRHEIDFNTLYGAFPDPHCTYLVMPALLAPFGSKVVIDGEFPYARFFDIQVTAPFDATEYRYDKWAGKGEVAIVDADIDPLPGHTNPFRVGNDRYAAKRSYQVTYKMAIGNPTQLNAAHKPPFYRGTGNLRYGGAIQFQGPWGAAKKPGHGRGVWDFGDIWIRYYAIDKQKEALGGVPLPKLYYQLPTGEKYYITCDFTKYAQVANEPSKIRDIGNSHPLKYHGPQVGWAKQYDIFLAITTGLMTALHKNSPKDKQYIRDLHLGVTGRGEDQPPPASYEPHATGCNYINYLLRGISIKKGHVVVLTGKLPTFPDTRNGARKMEGAQCRYWSLTSYDAGYPFNKIAGVEITSIMDDEIVLDKDRKYILVYSRPEDRPANAKAAHGATWINWGTVAIQSWTLRWLSVGPEWTMDIAPNEINLPWSTSNSTGTKFNPDLISKNGHQGFLGWYQPQVHYMTTKDFESLGTILQADKIPAWTVSQ